MAVVRLRSAIREAVAQLSIYRGVQGRGNCLWNEVVPGDVPSLHAVVPGIAGFFMRQPAQEAHLLGLGSLPAVWCGRGDKKTKRGKRFKGSFGNPRPTKGSVARRLRQKWQIPSGETLPVKVQ